MVSNYFRGLMYVLRGFSLIGKKGVRRFIAIPLLVNIVTFSSAIYIGVKQFGSLMERLLGSISWLPDWLETGISWILWPLFAIMIIVAVYYSFTVVANLIAAPFNSILALKTERYLRGQHIQADDAGESVMKIAGRTLGSEIKKLAHMLKWLVLLLMITIIPGINVIAPFAWLAYGAWMFALEYADYSMANHNMYFKEEVTTLKQNRFLSLGFGSGVLLLTSVPVLNFFAMPVSVTGGAAMWVDRLSKT